VDITYNSEAGDALALSELLDLEGKLIVGARLLQVLELNLQQAQSESAGIKLFRGTIV